MMDREGFGAVLFLVQRHVRVDDQLELRSWNMDMCLILRARSLETGCQLKFGQLVMDMECWECHIYVARSVSRRTAIQ